MLMGNFAGFIIYIYIYIYMGKLFF
jgi:hypothetical protein